MKKAIVLISFIAALIIGCHSNNLKTTLQKPGDAPADEYTININADTILVTKNGAKLVIPKGALAANTNTVTLEIKEAYTIGQMLKAGLTTKANGELLSSGGMIYINAKEENSVVIKQGIKVSLPADYLDKDMKVFKGEPDSEGNINWTSPAPLAENKQVNEIEMGKAIFTANCANCHIIGRDATGPNLAHFMKRFQGDKLYARGQMLHLPYSYLEGAGADTVSHYSTHDTAIDDRSELWYNQELYFCNLRKMYGSIGPLYPELNEEALNNIYRYIQNESDQRNLPLPSHSYLDSCIDSCRAYLAQTKHLIQQRDKQVNQKENLIKDNGELVIEENSDFNPNMPDNNEISAPSPANDNKVRPVSYESVYYQFTVETFGWYNIDVLIKGKDGVQESELFVRLTGEYKNKAQVYLIIPSVKIYVQGGPAERNPEDFAFQFKNGKIDLPQGVKAYIMAVSETKSSIAYSLKEFTTGTSQSFEISLTESSKEAFNIALSAISTDGLNIKVGDSKNAEAIRSTDTELEKINEELQKAQSLKPKNCDCNCVYGDNVKAVASVIEKK